MARSPQALNNLLDITYLVYINHKHILRWPRVLSFSAAREVSSLRQVSGVVNDRVGTLPRWMSDSTFEVVGALMKRFER